MDIKDVNGVNYSARKKTPNVFMFNFWSTNKDIRKNNIILNEILFQQALQRKLHFPEFQNKHGRKNKA